MLHDPIFHAFIPRKSSTKMMFTKPYRSLSVKYMKTSEHDDHKNAIPSKKWQLNALGLLGRMHDFLLTYAYFDALTLLSQRTIKPLLTSDKVIQN